MTTHTRRKIIELIE